MPLQPATGTKDLNPQQVERNKIINNELAVIYKLWGYKEVSPPIIERLSTLMAGGAIESIDILKLVSDEALGLRSEMTASIARAACTRFLYTKRPLRLWTSGPVFKRHQTIEGKISIEENFQSDVEIIGIKDIHAEIELLTLLLEATNTINKNSLYTTLHIGHTGLLELILNEYNGELKQKIKGILVNYDLVELDKLDISDEQKDRLISIQTSKIPPLKLLEELQSKYGEIKIVENLRRLFSVIEPLSINRQIKLNLDLTFHPNLNIYKGIVFQLVCKNKNENITIARGGRYDELIHKFSGNKLEGAGVGFSFSIDMIRELTEKIDQLKPPNSTLILFKNRNNISAAIKRQREYHCKGQRALLHLEEVKDVEKAKKIIEEMEISQFELID